MKIIFQEDPMKFQMAKPVWVKNYNEEKNIQLAFQKTFSVSEDDIKTGKTLFRIAVNNHYRLFVNGKFVVYGPQRACKGYFRVDETDITDKLVPGENTITVEAVYYNVGAFSYVSQGPMIQMELCKDGEVLFYTGCTKGMVEGKNERLELFTAIRVLSRHQKVQRFSYQRPFIECYSLPSEYSAPLELELVPGGSLLPREISYPEYNKTFLKTQVSSGSMEDVLPVPPHINYHGFNVEVEQNGGYRQEEMEAVYTDVIRNMKNVREKAVNAPIDRNEWISLNEKEFFLADLGCEKTGFLSFDILVPEECECYVLFDETLVDGAFDFMRLNTASLLPLFCKKMNGSFLSFEVHSMKYVKFLCKKGSCSIRNAGIVDYANPDTGKATFISSDPALNRIFLAAKETFIQNAPDLYMDCPSRERAGWLCDSFFTSRVEKVLTGNSKVEHDFLENFILPESFPDLPEGVLPMCYPSDSLKAQFIPNWVMWFVIELAEYYQRTQDRDLILRAKDRVYSILRYFDHFLGKAGLLEKLENWVFVEWSKANDWVQDINYPSNMLYAMVLEKTGELYSDEILLRRSSEMKETIHRLSFNGTFFTDHALLEDGELVKSGDISETCQYYAFFCGIADKERFPELLRIIREDFGPGRKCAKTHPGVEPANAFIGNYLRLEILSEYGYQSQIVEEIKEYFDYMATRTGTLWENDTPCASCNHGFASHAAVLLYRDVLGVKNPQCASNSIELDRAGIPDMEIEATIPVQGRVYKITLKNNARVIEEINQTA